VEFLYRERDLLPIMLQLDAIYKAYLGHGLP
jgi:hypothetical protein